jgi:outer membrane protein TolC
MAEVPLSIEEARAQVLENNLDLRVAFVDPLIANESLRAEAAKFEAVFQPFARYRNDDRPTLQTTVPNQQEVLSLGGGVDVPLRTGGRLSVDLTATKTDSPSAVLAGSQLFSSDATFSISQPLLRNAGEEVSTASIAIAGYNEQIAQARTRLLVIAQLAGVERSYWRLYAARRELEVAQRQFELAEEQLRSAERRVNAGDSPPLEAVRAQSGVAQRLEAIIVAENNVLATQRELKRTMNRADLDVGSAQALIPATPPDPAPYDLDPDRLTTLAIDNRDELLEVELGLLSDAVNEGFARNQLLPLLNLDGSYTFSSLATTARENLDRLVNNKFQSFSVGISGEVPLGNEAAEARLERAVLTRLQRVLSKAARAQSIRQDVLDAIDRVRAGWQRILAARQAAILAGRTLEGERRQFDAGSRTSTDVLDAATRLAEAQLAEIRALTDYQIAKVDLAVATGTTLGASKVSWSPQRPTPP